MSQKTANLSTIAILLLSLLSIFGMYKNNSMPTWVMIVCEAIIGFIALALLFIAFKEGYLDPKHDWPWGVGYCIFALGIGIALGWFTHPSLAILGCFILGLIAIIVAYLQGQSIKEKE